MAVTATVFTTRHHTVTLTAGAPTTETRPSIPTPGGSFPQAALSTLAATQARAFGDPDPTDAEAVATGLTAARRTVGSAGEADVNAAVYLVVLTGQFTCKASCFDISGHVSGSTLALIVSADLQLSAERLSNQVLNLAPLGTVTDLNCPPRWSPSPGCSETPLPKP